MESDPTVASRPQAPRALYASFDRVPSPKGAATHIERFAGTLFDFFGGGLLHVLGDDTLTGHDRDGDIEVLRFRGAEPNFLDRTQSYSRHLAQVLDQLEASLELCHFRDPWSGIPILERQHSYQTVYEVNGLPSIELASTYPLLSEPTLAKIRDAERFCWERADALVAPSRTIASNLVRLGADERRINVIPNGANPSLTQPDRPLDAPSQYAIYFGALQPWQGVDILLQAWARIADLDLQLVICSSSHPRLEKPLRKLATRLGLDDRVIWRHGLGRAELAGWVSHAAMSLAPLVECARNLDQGCCPLKILESMALGVLVIASDIPSVQEILIPGTGTLVHPGRPSELARAIRIHREHPDSARALAQRGRDHLERNLTWDKSLHSLRTIYHCLSRTATPEGLP